MQSSVRDMELARRVFRMAWLMFLMNRGGNVFCAADAIGA